MSLRVLRQRRRIEMATGQAQKVPGTKNVPRAVAPCEAGIVGPPDPPGSLQVQSGSVNCGRRKRRLENGSST